MFIAGNGNDIGKQIDALQAWHFSSVLLLEQSEWKECFSGTKHDKKLAMKYSRKRFFESYPDYFKKVRNGIVSKKNKKKMFNIFY